MIRNARICGLAIVLALFTAPQAWAETDPAVDEAEEVAVEDGEDADIDDEPTQDVDDEPAEDVDDEPAEDVDDEPAEDVDDEPAEDVDDEPAEDVDDEPAQEVDDEPPAEPDFDDIDDFDEPDEDLDVDEDEWPEEWDDDWDDDDFDDFADDIDFAPIEELDDALLDRITPISTFPFIEHGGHLRVRSQLRRNFDLDTGGTSAVLPPVENVFPAGQPADPDTSLLASADLRLRLSPTLHLTESLRVHTNVDLLDNIALGADPRHNFFVPGEPSPDRRLMDSSAGQPEPIHVRAAYGELNTFFGTFMVGRMLDHWGLGIFANDGECTSCDFGSQVDRAAWRLRAFDTYLTVAYDMPDAGWAPRQPGFDYGRSTQLGRFDSASQWSFQLFRDTLTREERERQARQLTEGEPVYNGGLYFSMRSQEADFIGDVVEPEDVDVSATDPETPYVYRGLQTYHFSPWVQFQINPEPDHHIRVELEGLTTFGSVDNATDGPVGFSDDPDQAQVNCFDDEARDQNPGVCRTGGDGQPTDTSIFQYGLALESEFNFGGRTTFGLNGGFASGGDEPNWGYLGEPADQVDFTRFNPDYHVDLILFREVIGTVTNASYVNPYVETKFLEGGLQHIEARLDAIASRAFDSEGTPGQSPWLGLELDGSLAYVDADSFTAAVDAGVLLPLGGLDAQEDIQRFNTYGDPGPFTADQSSRWAWTLQGRLKWDF